MSGSAALVGNGAIHEYGFIASLIKDYDRCIAVDGGLAHCQAMGITPDLIIGDLDSIPPELLKKYSKVPTTIFPKDKDHSDMELAIDTVRTRYNIHKFGLFGAMEKRMDHALSNLYLLQRHPEKAVIKTETETIIAIEGQRRMNCYPGQCISLIPLGSPVIGVTTQGLKWELSEATLNQNFFSLSNVCLGSFFDVSIAQGTLLCCLLRTCPSQII